MPVRDHGVDGEEFVVSGKVDKGRSEPAERTLNDEIATVGRARLFGRGGSGRRVVERVVRFGVVFAIGFGGGLFALEPALLAPRDGGRHPQ